MSAAPGRGHAVKNLCPECAHVRVIESSTGSRFLLCMRAKLDSRFTKYPPQPVVACPGFEGYGAQREAGAQ